MVSGKAPGEKLVEDVDSLIDEVEQAVRVAVGEETLEEDVDALVDRVNEAVRGVVSGNRGWVAVDTLVDRVSEAVRAALGEETLAEDVDTLLGRVGKSVRAAASRGSEAAESVGQSLRDRIRLVLDGVRGSGRDSVVMVRVNKYSRERMDELVEADLVGSRSEAAAFLIAEGIKARQGLFDGIESRIDAIRKAKEELQRLLNEDEKARS